MSTLKIIHAADLHLDSPFEGLPSGKASVRRGEQRGLLSRLAELALREKADIVLLSGDLLDSDNTYYETGDELIRSLGSMGVPVFIAPGNHDYYSDKSPYARLELPENVHVFTKGQIQCAELPFLGLRVYGAAFTDKRSPALLEGFSAPRPEGIKNPLRTHGALVDLQPHQRGPACRQRHRLRGPGPHSQGQRAAAGRLHLVRLARLPRRTGL